MKSFNLQRLRSSLGFDGLFIVDPICHKGGLTLFWKIAREVEIVNYSMRHICALVHIGVLENPWMFIGFYGNPDRDLRAGSWSLLSHINSLVPYEWLYMGDF